MPKQAGLPALGRDMGGRLQLVVAGYGDTVL